MQEFLLAIAAVALIGLTVDLLIKVMSTIIKIAIAIIIIFFLIVPFAALTITLS